MHPTTMETHRIYNELMETQRKIGLGPLAHLYERWLADPDAR